MVTVSGNGSVAKGADGLSFQDVVLPVTYTGNRLTRLDLRPLSFVRDTNPDTLGFDVYDLLRQYPVVVAALLLIKAPILANVRNAAIVCDDPAQKRFLEHTLLDSDLVYRACEQLLSS